MLDLDNKLPSLLKTLREQRVELERIIQLDPKVLWNEDLRNKVEECRVQLKKVQRVLARFSQEGDN